MKEVKTVERQAGLPAQKIAVVVGGSSGIGRESVLKLYGRGYRVFNLSRAPFEGEEASSISTDVAKEGEAYTSIQEVAEQANVIDLLVYSAGYSLVAPVELCKSEDYRYLFEVNYFGAIEAIRAATPYLKRRGGRVILVGSLAGEMPIPFDGFYSSSKAALCMLAREADVELSPYGVRVSALLPGGTATDFTYHRRTYAKEQAGSYTRKAKSAQAALANEEQGGMKPSLVANALLKLAEQKSPPTVRVAGGKNAFYYRLSRLLPNRVVGWLVRKKFNQK